MVDGGNLGMGDCGTWESRDSVIVYCFDQILVEFPILLLTFIVRGKNTSLIFSK